MQCVGVLIHNGERGFEDLRDKRNELQYLFPCLDQRYDPQKVMVLQINQVRFMSERTIHVYSIERIIEKSPENVPPLFTYPSSNTKSVNTPSFYPGNTDTPYCFHKGLYFLVKDTKKQWAIYHANNTTRPLYLEPNFPWFFQKYSNTLAYTKGKKVVTNGKILHTSPYEIISFDIPDKQHKLICYYNTQHNPDIEFQYNNRSIFKKNKRTYKQNAASELYPQFSTNKDYFSYYKNHEKNPEIWDIVVCPTGSPDKTIKTITNVRMYDINETAFFYHDSFQWLDNRLYYFKHDQPLSIFEFTPSPPGTRQIRLTGNSLTRKKKEHSHYGTKIIDIELTVDIIATDWFQVAKDKNGRLMFIVECLIQTRHQNKPKYNSYEGPVRRIVIFK